MVPATQKADWIAIVTDAAPAAAKARVQSLLRGLSSDELQYLASFLGTCTLENFDPFIAPHYRLSLAVQRFDAQRPIKGQTLDRQHKMFVALELFRRAASAMTKAETRDESTDSRRE